MPPDVFGKGPAKFQIKAPNTLPRRIPTNAEVRDLTEVCDVHTEVGCRDRAMVLVFADCGLRSIELRRLLHSDINWPEHSMLIRGPKNNEDRVIFFGHTTARALRAYLQVRRTVHRTKDGDYVPPGRYAEHDYLFADVYGRPLKYRHLVQILHRLAVAAGIPRERRPTLHGFRGYFATTLYRSHRVEVEDIRKLGGWKSIEMVLRYCRLVSRDLKIAHQKASIIDRLGLD